MLNRLWVAIALVGAAVVLFGGMTHTVQDPAECPATWDGDTVIATEVFDADGEIAGYWCLVEGSIGSDGIQRYLSIPIGEAEGFPSWYGFLPLTAAGAGFGLTRVLTKSSEDSGAAGGELT